MKTLIVLTSIVLVIACTSATNLAQQTKPRETPVAVGEMAPDFTLVDQNGKEVTLSEAQTKSPVVLVFYRGYW